MEHQIVFRGKAGEYFGIWIVNILLTILTLGIYSAWAKVRTNRYFYGNTFIDGHSFEYHATGKQILIGRVIVVAALVLYQILVAINPILAILLALVYVGLFPYLIVRGLNFAYRMTSYRNVRFGFHGTYMGAAWALIILPILSVFTAYLILPIVSRTIANFVAKNTTYGDRPFDLNMPLGPLYAAFAAIIGTFFVAFIILGLWGVFGLGVGDFFAQGAQVTPENAAIVPLIAVAIFLPMFLFLFVGQLVYAAVFRNLTFNNLELDGKHRFTSTISIAGYVFIVVTNALATIFTLGLMAPWARVRLSRYLANHTTLIAGGPLDEYSSSIRDSSGVVGSEFMDIEGVDVGVAI